ncbi:MAG: MmgE/PrpD family protein [Lachnospiraceae bacterium]|nr:MmgE/PrpD family protein [Lachnospiraceae bacterium]
MLRSPHNKGANMNCITDYRLENFILGLQWEKLPCEVQDRLRSCFTDLLGAIVTGSRSETFEAGLKLAKKLSLPGDVPVIGSTETFSVGMAFGQIPPDDCRTSHAGGARGDPPSGSHRRSAGQEDHFPDQRIPRKRIRKYKKPAERRAFRFHV